MDAIDILEQRARQLAEQGRQKMPAQWLDNPTRDAPAPATEHAKPPKADAAPLTPAQARSAAQSARMRARWAAKKAQERTRG